MGEQQVTNHGENTHKLNTQTNKIKKTKQLFEIKTFQQKVFWGKKTFYYFGMGEKV